MQLDAVVYSRSKAPVSRRRIAKYDRVAVRAACDLPLDDHTSDLAVAVQELEAYIRSIPEISVHIDPSSHAFILDELLIDGLELCFPKTGRPVKQFYLTRHTLTLIGRKANQLHIRVSILRQIKSGVRKFVVQFWASCIFRGRRRPRWHLVFGPLTKYVCRRQHHLALQLKDLNIETKKCKTIDFQVLCDSQARGLEEASLEGNSSRLFQLLRKLRPYVPRRGVRLFDAAGQPAGSDRSERLVVREAFSSAS